MQFKLAMLALLGFALTISTVDAAKNNNKSNVKQNNKFNLVGSLGAAKSGAAKKTEAKSNLGKPMNNKRATPASVKKVATTPSKKKIVKKVVKKVRHRRDADAHLAKENNQIDNVVQKAKHLCRRVAKQFW